MSKKKNRKKASIGASDTNASEKEEKIEESAESVEKMIEEDDPEGEKEVLEIPEEETQTGEETEKAGDDDSEGTEEPNEPDDENKDKDKKKEPKKQKDEARSAKKRLTGKNGKDNKIFLILSFFVPFLIMGVVFARAGVYPFGDRQTMYSDCKQQYLPFLKEFQRKIQSGDSLLYSWRNGLGTNFMSMIGYYIASPLNWLTFFVPVKYVREAMAVFMMIKIGCSSLFMAIFLKRIYNRNDLSLVAFGSCYAFCDFMMGYYWNIIWLDSVALLPLVALGVYLIVHEKKYKLYVISLAVAFLASYYIGYMICVFVVLWFIVQSIMKKSKLDVFCEDILKMAMYSALAIAMTLPVTMTCLIQLQNTVGTDDSFPDKIEIYNNFAEVAANLFSFHQPTTMEGLPNIGTGVFCVLLIAVFVRAKEISLREKISYLSLLGFIFVSLNINILDYMWHGFHFPNLIPYRFSFLFSFVLVVIAYRAFTVFVELDKKDIIGMSVVAVIMICLSVFYLEKKAIIGSLIVAALYILFMALYEMDMLDRRLLTIFASLVIVAEMCVECSVGVDTVGTTKHEGYPDKEESVAELVKFAEDVNPDDLFRVEQTYYSTKNDGMIYGYNGIGQFSSTSYKNLITFTSRFGVVSKRSSYQYLLTSPVTSMYMGVEYVISRDGYLGGETTLEKYKTSSDGQATMYKNKYYLPVGYMANSKVNDVEMENDSVFVTQNKVFRATTGLQKDVYDILKPTSFDCDKMEHSEEKGGIIDYKLVSGEKSGEINVTYTAPKDGMIYAWANVKSDNELRVQSETIDHTYDIDAQRYIFPLGYYKKGETVTIHVDAEKDAKNKIVAAYLDESILEAGYSKLSDETLKVTDYSSTSVKGTINVKQDGVFLTSIPYEKGWTLFVDGERVKTREAMEVFIAADLTSGEHEIEFKYMPQGFIPGVVLSLTALIIFAAIWLDESLRKKGTTLSKVILRK